MSDTTSWSRHPGSSPELCIQCEKRPPKKPRRICSPCRAENEKKARVERIEQDRDKPCVVDGCPEPREVTKTQVRPRCTGHRREQRAEQRRKKGLPERKRRPGDIPETHWWCSRCEEIKLVDEFHKSKDRERGLRTRCKQCEYETYLERLRADPEGVRKASRESMRRNRRRRTYGITNEEFDARVLEQEGRCAVCQRLRPLVPDHDHDHEAPKSPEAIRGVICGQCNSALGLVGEDPEVLLALVSYLQDPPRPFR